jgi:hypothetical protein
MRLIISIAALVLIASPAMASSESDILTCASVKDSSERLACFDAIAKLILARETTMPENYILQRFKKTADK